MHQAYHFMSFSQVLLRYAMARSRHQTRSPRYISNQKQDLSTIQALIPSGCRDETAGVFDKFSNVSARDCTKPFPHASRAMPGRSMLATEASATSRTAQRLRSPETASAPAQGYRKSILLRVRFTEMSGNLSIKTHAKGFSERRAASAEERDSAASPFRRRERSPPLKATRNRMSGAVALSRVAPIPERTATADRGGAETAAQRVDCGLRRGQPRGRGIR